jgi:hypothetical protein
MKLRVLVLEGRGSELLATEGQGSETHKPRSMAPGPFTPGCTNSRNKALRSLGKTGTCRGQDVRKSENGVPFHGTLAVGNYFNDVSAGPSDTSSGRLKDRAIRNALTY